MKFLIIAFLLLVAALLAAMLIRGRRSPVGARAMGTSTFFVLTALNDGPRHGYGIVGEVAELSEGLVRLKVGTLYGVLDRLVREGLVEVDSEEVHQGRLRRYYRLTESGRSVHDVEVDRLLANNRGRAVPGADRERGGET